MTPQAKSILELFRSTGAYLQGPFSPHQRPAQRRIPAMRPGAAASRPPPKNWAGLLAERCAGWRRPIGLVVSPALGGLIIGHEVARALGNAFIFTERDAATGKMMLRRGFKVEPGETAVVVEDVVTTGGSTREVIDVLRAAGAQVSGGGVHHRPQRRPAPTWAFRAWRWPPCKWWPTTPEECPLCRERHSRGEARARAQPDAPHPDHAGLRRRRDFTAGRCSPACPPFRERSRRFSPASEGRPVHVAGSGRTDAGVHALEQVAAFRSANPIPLAQPAARRQPPAAARHPRLCGRGSRPPIFIPRFDAKAKTYEYRICRGEVCSPFEWPYAAPLSYPLDEERMIAAGARLRRRARFLRFRRLRRPRCAGAHRRCERSSLPRWSARGEPADLPHPRQRISETHGAQHRGYTDRGGQRQHRGFERAARGIRPHGAR